MFVKFMLADEWLNRIDHGVETVNPTWIQVKESIEALDGARKTTLILSDGKDSSHYILVAGQYNGRLLVSATKDNHNFLSLVDADLSTNKIGLFVGGQDGEYEERKCVPLAWALEAAKHFYETGELMAAMNWVDDN